MTIILFRDDFCHDIFEFGFATVSLTNEFQVSANGQSATLNATVPIQTFDDNLNFYNRVIVANVQLAATSDTTSGVSTSRFVNGKFRFLSNGHTVSTVANVTGSIAVDGQQTLADSVGTIESSMSVFIDISQ